MRLCFCALYYVCVCQISALVDEVSALKKENETLQMKLKASKGEKTGIIIIMQGNFCVCTCIYDYNYVCIETVKLELQLLLEKGEASTELKRTDRPQGDRWIV